MSERVLKERYAIQQLLGKNAGRQTLLARDLQTQELVAIKLLTFSADFQWDDLKLFEREAETLQSLSHPAIPRYLDHFEVETSKTKGLALVQSYIEAKSLAEWVKLGRTFNEGEVKQLATALLEILTYLHGRQPPVIHRDIKPSNILLGDRSGNCIGQVYLVDFGSVQTLAAREGSTITVVGTYGYMPPEQFGGRAVPASDLYSLGATLIYLVTGTHPADLPQEDLRIQFQPKIQIDSAFVDWLKWMTEPDLNNRLTSTGEALKALEEPIQREGIPPVVRKPAASKVQLKKDRNTLEIIIPAAFWTNCLLSEPFRILCSIWFVVGTVVFILMKAKSSIDFTLPLGFWIIVLCVNLIGVLFMLQSTRLRIDRQQICLTYGWFKALRYQVQSSSPRQTICKLGFLLHYDIKLGVLHDRNLGLRRKDIQVWAGTKEYKIPTEDLTNCEVDWIAYELSEWLGLPITK
ncbi:MAG: serine/threonine protein kinase [Microcoleus sp.]